MNYLLQHSAGSGKSLTIACLTAALLDDKAAGFHLVIVLTAGLRYR